MPPTTPNEAAEPLPNFAAIAKYIDEDKFVEQFPDPFIIQMPVAAEGEGKKKQYKTMLVKPDMMGNPMAGPGSGDTEKNVIPIKKSMNAGYAKMITVGRAPNNDIQLARPEISKFHAYFMQNDEGSWCLYDAGSTNGTVKNETRLAEGEAHELQDGDTIVFGDRQRFTYYSPSGFYNHLRFGKP